MKLIQIYVLIAISFFVSCNKLGQSNSARVGIDPAPEYLASSAMSDSFEVAAGASSTTDLSVDNTHVIIKKSALNKEFLFSVNMLLQTPTPTFSTLQSRVVSFIFRDQNVYLLDVTGNHNVGENNIPQNLLLAQFKVISENATSITLDFNEGMKSVITAGDMFASDDPQAKGSDYELPIAKIVMSFLDEVKMNADALFIRQIAQIEMTSEKNEIKATPLEIRYQIKPYLPDPNFVPVRSPGFDKVGYFEANPLQTKEGTTIHYATKWNDKKPMVFAISENTPEKYRDLIKSAVLYWNKAMGENKISVIQLTDKNVTAPAFNYNILQWAQFDGAGYAFADMHIDPRSGEVTSAQVFFPTAFTEASVPKRLRLLAGKKMHARSKRMEIGLKGFKSSKICARDVYKDFAEMELSDITPEAMEKAMRDYVYEVIAHEMGHVIGLRHNFAGNLIANYDAKDRPAMALNYYKNMQAPSAPDGSKVIASSSVMEYSRFEESSWNGDMLQKPNEKALIYDEMSIRYLYQNVALPESRPLFCTDYHTNVYADCNTSDAGRSVISASTGMYEFNLDTLAARIINIYITKSKLAEEPSVQLVPVSEVDLDAKAFAKNQGIDFAKFISLLKVDTKFIAVRSAFMPVLKQNSEKIEELEKVYLQKEVERLGGLRTLAKAIPLDFDVQLKKRFAELLENPFYNSGTLRDGKKYFFTSEEIQTMKEQVDLAARQIKNEFILNEIKALSGESFDFEESYGQSAPEEKTKWADSKLTEQFADLLLYRFKHYALKRGDQIIETEYLTKEGKRTKVELPTYYFSPDIRAASAKLFSTGGAAIDFAYVEKQAAAEMVTADLALLGDEEKLDKASLNKEVLKWFLFNKQIESTLSE
jgi:Met-zincin